MLVILWLALCLVALFLILLLPAIWRHEIFNRYSGSRLVSCPEDHHAAAVTIDVHHAEATAINGYPELRLCNCTRWPERSGCKQGCLAQALQTEPYAPGRGKGKQICQLPILLAAFVAWCLGILWHSHFLFRAEWTTALGLSHDQVRQMVWWISPHLLTLAACLLFAYGVAWLLAVCHRKGILPGVLVSLLFCGALIAASWYGLTSLPHDLLMIETGYTVVAALLMGAIIGGLNRRHVLPPA